ncbi:hypothetical protein H6F77_26285 [Microcoleus sp. FACHB-831]|nr:hypothetical protein [Microcoleus sp. FACHB-831]
MLKEGSINRNQVRFNIAVQGCLLLLTFGISKSSRRSPGSCKIVGRAIASELVLFMDNYRTSLDTKLFPRYS